MNNSFRLPIVFLASMAVSTLSHAKEAPDSFPVSLAVSGWGFSQGLEAQNQDDGSLVMTMAARSAWATPAAQWPVSPGIELEVQGLPGGGKIVAQAEWFDSAGAFISADSVLRLNGSGAQADKEALTPPPNAVRFRLKFWMEGEKIQASLTSVTLTREPAWQKGEALQDEPPAENPKLFPDEGLTIKADGTTSQLTLDEGTASAGLHFDNAVEVREGLRLLLPVLELPPGSSVSMQALCWNGKGGGRGFMGQMDLINGIAEVADYDVKIPSEMEDGKRPKYITLKVWAIGKTGRPVRIGAIHFASPAEK